MNKWITKNGYQIHQIIRGRSNCFLILKDNKFLLVDTSRKSKRNILIDRIEEYRLKGFTLEAIILTHTHFDHAENAACLKERFKIPIFVNKYEAEYLKFGNNPVTRGSFFITRGLTNLWEKKLKSYFKYEPVEVDYLVEGIFNLEEFGFNAYIMHTPGHSIGSMSIIVDNEIAVVGDAMFGVFKGTVFPPFTNDPKVMVDSWGKLLDTGCSVFLPSHGTSDIRELLEKQYNKYKKGYPQ
jgi:hydroxyacylglutathione hydrolase